MSTGEGGASATRNPWWIPPFLGRVPPAVPQPQLQLLGAVALASCFEHFDQAMLTQAIKQIAVDFGIAEQGLGNLLGWVRLGAVPALLLVPFADRLGRRRVFLLSMVVMSVATVACAFAPTVEVFIGLQMLARMFMVTMSATSFVIVSEEVAAAHRGWSIGILGALGAFGVGLSAMLFAAIDVLPYGWRAMYVVGMTPLLLLPHFRREVSETGRFQRAQAARADGRGWTTGWWDPIAGLLRSHPRRALVVGLIGALASAGHGVGFSFAAYYVQADHGWAPGQFTAMAMVAGMAGIIGHPFAGRFADRRGRRPVGFLLFAIYPFLAVAFYHGPGWALPFLWIPLIFTLTGGITIARALSTELFPTSHRGTSAGWLQLADALGAAAGLFLVSWGTAAGSSNTPMISWVVFATLGAGLLVLTLPESSRRAVSRRRT